MADKEAKADAKKRIKQLENQIIKFKHLIQTALELTERDRTGLQRQISLRESIEKLEQEKSKLEEQLNLVEENSDSNEMLEAVVNLETENVKLRAKFQKVLSEVAKENQQISQLKRENHELNVILEDLENEKARLMEKIRLIRENSSGLTCETVSLQERLPPIVNQNNGENNYFS